MIQVEELKTPGLKPAPTVRVLLRVLRCLRSNIFHRWGCAARAVSSKAPTLNPRAFTFGGVSAIVTSMGLIIGLESATASTATIVSGLLIVAVADNISDSLSIHMYQEAERLEAQTALKTTLTNFVVRLVVALSFVVVVMTLPESYAGTIAIGWGFLLLSGLSYLLARVRGVSPFGEVGKHIGIAILVIATSRLIGSWILHHVSTSNSG